VTASLDVHLAGIAAGDAAAFARWMAGAEGRLRLSLKSLAREVDVEAILQETLLRVWQVAPRFTPDGAPDALLRFAVRIGRNLAVSELRRHRPETGADPPEDQNEPAAWPEAVPDPLLRQAIVECHDQLPGKPAQALDARLAAAGGEPDAALAERLGMRLNTFLQNFTRARKLLAECLRGRGVILELEMRMRGPEVSR
jgi:RNA polymerase sigma-70 factor (ECF subfamily)